MYDLEVLVGAVKTRPHLVINAVQFNQLSNLIESERYSEAYDFSCNLLDEGISDLRVICYFFCAALHKFSLKNLQPILESFTKILQELAPRPRLKQDLTSLTWFNKQLRIILNPQHPSYGALGAFTEEDFKSCIAQYILSLESFALKTSEIKHCLENYLASLSAIALPQIADEPAINLIVEPQLQAGFYYSSLLTELLNKIDDLQQLLVKAENKKCAILYRLLKDELKNSDLPKYFPIEFKRFMLFSLEYDKILSEIYISMEQLVAFPLLEKYCKYNYLSFISDEEIEASLGK